MKVKCIKTKLEDNHPYFMKDHSHYLNIGDEFIVYGLTFETDGERSVAIWNEQHIISAPMDIFEIIDNSIPNTWLIDIDKYGGVWLCPELFHRENFLENHSEWEENERKEFEVFRAEFEKKY